MRRLPPDTVRALDALAEAEAVAPIDLALARLVAGLDAEHADADPARQRTLALSAALVSRETRDGHSAVDLAAHAGHAFPEDEHARAVFRGVPEMPALDVWRAHLAASPTVGGADTSCPLVLVGDHLALRRHWDAERRVARAITDRLAASDEPPTAAARAALARLFPPRADGALDRQALAAAAALRQRALFVAGGPGTGKTYTAARLLALVLAERPAARVALAAPTGKAASRLSESVEARVAELPADLGGAVPTAAVTLHKLLGAHPERSGFRHDARAPLPHDIVLVDEGSMVDLALFDALLAALRPDARLIVLGDPDQLPPVGVGTTFSDVVSEGAGPAPPALAAFCADLGLADVPSSPTASRLAGAVVELTESRRFTADSDVGTFAVAVRDGEAAAAVEALRQRPALDLVEGDPAGSALAWALPLARETVAAATPEAALAVLERFRLLAAVRRGPRGVEGLNGAIEQALRDERLVRWSPYGPRVYPGRPVLVTVNDRDTDLRNGDVGVCWGRGGDRRVVFGPDKEVAWARMPAHEPAWALTVHKSQGSEFDAVGVVLPEPGTRGATLVTRELLYTAATRAKRSVTVFGAADEVALAVETRQRRASGLAARLADAAGGTA
ncbi:exodeoxyribonuclease V subunit alpha [Rubrivirga sp. IMCC45206]|uniref:exodeoxyribonuclease V subunit alpha n=1 Tax=Rubrivirga sp. IMCC45206 TaxID=3391614 RepID=UPI00398FDFF9